jgi:hypothetical protein
LHLQYCESYMPSPTMLESFTKITFNIYYENCYCRDVVEF